MRYSDSSELSKVSLLSFTLLIFSAGIVEGINPYPAKAASARTIDAAPTLLLAQSTPPANPAVTPQSASSPVSSEQSNREGGDSTLWWLLFLCLGLPFLLAWLGSKNRTTVVKPSTLILTPETGNTARIYWEIAPEKIQRLRRQGGKNLVVRLMDVTNINPQVTNPEVVQQVPCSLGSPLISLQVPEVDREYQAELGCLTQDGGWISLAKSAPAYFPAPSPFLGGLGAGIVTAIGSNAISSVDSPSGTQGTASQPQVAGKVVDKIQVDVIENSTSAAEAENAVVDHPANPVAENTQVIDNAVEGEKVEMADAPAEEVENAEVIDSPPEADSTQAIDSSAEEVAGQVEIVDAPADSLEVDVWDGQEEATPVTAPTTPIATEAGINAGIAEPEPELSTTTSDVVPEASSEAIESPPEIPDPEIFDNSDLSHSSEAIASPPPELLATASEVITEASPEAIESAIPLPEATNDEMAPDAVESKAGIAEPSDSEDLPPEEVNPPLSSVVPTVDDSGSSLNWGVVGGAAAAEAAVPLPKEEIVIETPLPKVTLIPSDEVTINGSWVLPESTKATYESQGGIQLALRIYNVTDIDPEMPLTGDFRQFTVAETGLTAPLTLENLPNNPSSNSAHSGTDSEISYGDYQGELGYLTATDQWLGIAKSNRVRLSLVGKTQIRLTMNTPTQGYVTWSIAPRDNQILKSQKINGLRLRIYEVTNIDLDQTPANDTQEYACEMDQRDRYVPITVGDRPYADYIAELGYMTNTEEWLRIIRSLHTRFFS